MSNRLKGPGGFNNIDLLIQYKDSTFVKDKNDPDKIAGVMLRPQVDQSYITKKDAPTKGETNPALATTGKFYSMRQFEQMQEAGKVIPQSDGSSMLAVNASVQKAGDGQLVIMTPKSTDGLEGEALEKVEKHNARYQLNPHTRVDKLNSKTMEKQTAVTKIARETEAANKAAEKQAEAKAPEASAEMEGPEV